MSQKVIKITGWVLTTIISLVLIMSISMKLTQNQTAIQQAANFGFNGSTYFMIGVIELISLILFIIPRTGVIGSLLLIAYMGGAIATHVQHQDSITMAVIIETLIWIAALLRFPELKQRLFGTKAI